MRQKAKESAQVKRARQKIKEQMKTDEKKMNAKALSAMSVLIKEQLSRQKSVRVSLKKRNITTLDDKKSVVIKKESKFIQKMMGQIKAQNSPLPEHSLEGRIKTLSENNSDE